MASIKRYPLPFLKHKKLVYAVINGDIEYVRANVPEKVAVDQSIIPYPGGQSTYMAFLAVEHDTPSVLEYLLQQGGDSSLKDHRGMNLFDKVASLPGANKEFTDILFVLENDSLSSLLNDQTATGNTAVHLAVATANLYTLNAMLKMSPDIMVATVKNTRGDTPLILAIKNRDSTMASMLFRYASHVSHEPLSTTDRDGYTALELADMYLPGFVSMMTIELSRPVSSSRSSSPLLKSRSRSSSLSVNDDELANNNELVFDDFLHDNAPLFNDDDDKRLADERVKALQKEYELIIEGKNTKINELIANMTDIRTPSEYNELVEASVRDKNRIDSLNSELSSKVTQLTATEQDLETTRSELITVKNELVTTQEYRHQDLIEIVNGDRHFNDERVTNQKVEIDELSDALAAISDEAQESNERINILNSEMAKLISERDFMEQNLSEKKKERKRKMGLLESKLNQALSKIASQDAEVKKKIIEIVGLKETVAALKDSIEVVKSNGLDTKAELKATQEGHATALTKLSKCDKTIAVMNKKNEGLKADLQVKEAVLKKRDENASEVSWSRSEIKKLTKLLNKAEVDKSELLDKVMALRQDVTYKEENVTSLAERVTELRRDLTKALQELAREIKKTADLTLKSAADKQLSDDLERQVKAQTSALSAYKDEIENVFKADSDKETEKLTAALTIELARTSDFERRVKDLMDANSALESNADQRIQTLESAINDTKNAYAIELKRRQVCETEASEERINHSMAITKMTDRRTISDRKLKDASKELEVARASITTLKETIETLKRNHTTLSDRRAKEFEDKLEASRATYEDALKDNIDYSEQEIRNIKTKMSELKIKFEKQLIAVESDYDDTLIAEAFKHKTDMAALRDEVKNDMSMLKERHKQELDELYTTYSNELSGMSKTRQVGFMKQNKQLKEQLEKQEVEFDIARRADEATHQETIYGMNKQINHLKRELTKMKA